VIPLSKINFTAGFVLSKKTWLEGPRARPATGRASYRTATNFLDKN